MRKYLFVCTLLLVGCAGNSDDATVFPYQPEPPVQPIVHHHPDIDELVISPRVVEYMDGGGIVAVTAEISFTDTGLDLQSLWVQLPDGTRVEFRRSFATESGTFTEGIAFPTDKFGAFSVELWLEDKAGDSSRHYTEVIDVVGNVPVSAGGIWHGTVSNDLVGQSFDMSGVVTEHNAEGRFMIDGKTQFVVRDISIDGAEIAATISAFTRPEAVFLPEGDASGALSGSLVERSRIEAEWTLDSGEFGTLILEYDDLYERGSAIARLVGTWDSPWGEIFNIDALGEMFAQRENGCVTDGQVQLIDADYNVYRVELNFWCLPFYVSGLGVLGDEAGTDDAFTLILSAPQSYLFTTGTLLQQ